MDGFGFRWMNFLDLRSSCRDSRGARTLQVHSLVGMFEGGGHGNGVLMILSRVPKAFPVCICGYKIK